MIQESDVEFHKSNAKRSALSGLHYLFPIPKRPTPSKTWVFTDELLEEYQILEHTSCEMCDLPTGIQMAMEFEEAIEMEVKLKRRLRLWLPSESRNGGLSLAIEHIHWICRMCRIWISPLQLAKRIS